MSDFHELSISEIRKLTPNSVCISFEVPESLKKDFKFMPGQYITIRKDFGGEEVRRSYSICTSPGSGNLSVGVKRVKNGAFSVFANEELQAGDTLEVMPPEGRFVLDPDKGNKNNYIAFAAGSGITPVLSILASALEEEPQSRCYLVFGNRSESEMMFREELSALESAYPDRFFVEYLFSRSKENYGVFGKIEKSTVNFILKNKFDRADYDQYFLCGPEGMIENMTTYLREKGVDPAKIRKEFFSSTQEGDEPVLQEGMTEVSVILDDESFTFVMSRESLVLDAALKEDIDAPYSCRGGICSTCIARLKEGSVTMRKNQILTDDELEDGYILTCQSHPTSAKIVVDYDDV